MNFQHRNRVEKCVYALLLCGAFLSFLLNFSFEIIVKDSAAAEQSQSEIVNINLLDISSCQIF